MPGHIGFAAYCRALAALPGTSAEIAEKCGLTARGVGGMMRRFWQLRLVTPGGIGYRKATIWYRGERDAVYSPKIAGKCRPYANHIVFASIIRALEEARTARQLGEDVGISLLSAQTAIRHLKAENLVYLSEWGLCSFGRPVAKYELGKCKDAPKPLPQSNQVKWARYTQRKTYKALETLDGRGFANG